MLISSSLVHSILVSFTKWNFTFLEATEIQQVVRSKLAYLLTFIPILLAESYHLAAWMAAQSLSMVPDLLAKLSSSVELELQFNFAVFLVLLAVLISDAILKVSKMPVIVLA